MKKTRQNKRKKATAQGIFTGIDLFSIEMQYLYQILSILNIYNSPEIHDHPHCLPPSNLSLTLSTQK